MILSTHFYHYISSQGSKDLFMLDVHYVLEQQGSEAPLQWRKNCKNVTQPISLPLEFIFLSTSSLAHHKRGTPHFACLYERCV
jgi:hypothetical protein